MNFGEITIKDLLLLSRDRRTLFMLIALPLAFIAIIGSSTGQLFDQAQNSRNYKLGVLNMADDDLSQALVDELYTLKALDVVPMKDKKSARQELAEDKIHVLLEIGKDYSARVEELDVYDIVKPDEGRLQGNPKSLDVSVSAGSFLANSVQLVEVAVLSKIIKTVSPTVLDKHPKLYDKFKKASLKSKPRREGEPEESPALPPNANEAPSLNTIVYQTVVPGYTVMFVFFIVSFMARSFIGERDMGTLNRLRLAPITRSGMIVGKTVPFLVISLAQTAILFLAGKLLFGMNWGHQPWLLLPVMFCTSLAATALGLVVASLVRTESQVTAYANFLVLTMAGISGCMMPRSWQPELMQKIGLITPHAWALIAYDQILNRAEPEPTVVIKSCLTMTAFAAAYFAVGWWRSRVTE